MGALSAALLLGCGGAKKEADAPIGVSVVSSPASMPVSYNFSSIDDRPVSSDAARGKVAVFALVTTWDLASQAQVDFLLAMAKNDGDKVFYGLIALEEKSNRELVEAYVRMLKVPFPAAMASPSAMRHGGPFGEIREVPTLVLIDAQGRVAWTKTGLVKADEIRAAMRALPGK
jgi:hypothetical protein